MASKREPSRRRDSGRRAELIEAASRVINREGIAAATIRRIGEEAEVPGSLVHYWFADKDELLQEVLTADIAELQNSVATASEAGKSLLDQLRAAFRVIEESERGRQIRPYEMTTWALRKPGMAHVATDLYTSYRSLGIEAMSAWMTATDTKLPADTSVVAQFVVSLFDGVVLAWLADPDNTDVDGVLRLACDLITTFTPKAPGAS